MGRQKNDNVLERNEKKLNHQPTTFLSGGEGSPY